MLIYFLKYAIIVLLKIKNRDFLKNKLECWVKLNWTRLDCIKLN